MSSDIKMIELLKEVDNHWRPYHLLSKSGYFYFGQFWSQRPKILAVASVLANLKNIKRVFENFDFWPLFDRFFMSRVSRGRQVTFDKLPVGPKPKEKLPFFGGDFFFGLKKIKVTEQPAKKVEKTKKNMQNKKVWSNLSPPEKDRVKEVIFQMYYTQRLSLPYGLVSL